MFYDIYGLCLQATRPLPGLRAASGSRRPDVRVSLEGLPGWLKDSAASCSQPWHVSSCRDGRGQPGLKIWRLGDGAYFWFRYSDGTHFIVDGQGCRVWAAWPAKGFLEDVAAYLLGPVLGFALRLRGVPSLHASAVVVGGRTVALLGPAGSGKSTTVAALARRGYAVISEDVVPIVPMGSAFLAYPGHTYVRLWPQAVTLLFGSPNELPRLAPSWEKRYLDLPEKGYSIQTQPLPLAAIYVLGDRANVPEAPFVEEASPRERLMTLIANTYAARLLDERQRAEEFELLARLAAGVSVRRLTPHADPAHLDRLCDVILADFHRPTHGRLTERQRSESAS